MSRRTIRRPQKRVTKDVQIAKTRIDAQVAGSGRVELLYPGFEYEVLVGNGDSDAIGAPNSKLPGSSGWLQSTSYAPIHSRIREVIQNFVDHLIRQVCQSGARVYQNTEGLEGWVGDGGRDAGSRFGDAERCEIDPVSAIRQLVVGIQDSPVSDWRGRVYMYRK